jgi:hypothetical protein
MNFVQVLSMGRVSAVKWRLLAATSGRINFKAIEAD